MVTRQMLPSSHLVPINPAAGDPRAGAAYLADAFSEFTSAASRLENSYQELQKEVTQLRAILAERNQDLHSSRAETAQMRLALRHIVDSLPCGILVLEDKTRIGLINPEARRLLETKAGRIETLDDIPPASRVAVEGTEYEFCVRSASTERWLAVRTRQLMGDRPTQTRRPQQTVVIVRDTSSQKKLQDEREAARNVVALAGVAAELAHEIRNPLASLELFAGLIGEKSPSAANYVAQLRAGIRSLTATVNNVLRFHSAGSLRLVRIELNSVLQRAVEFVRPLAEQKNIALLLATEPGETMIAGDENAIQQVVLNLAGNAFRHTAAGGRLTITARRVTTGAGVVAQVEFADDGCGMSPEVMARVFEPGFSGSSQTPGLGLAVCRKIVEQHGGTLRVTSRQGEGATFVLEVPAKL
jgi:signal transduction histidine kinase